MEEAKETEEKVKPLSKRELERSLKEIQRLRATLENTTNPSKRKKLIIELFEKTDELENQLNHTLGTDELLQADIDKIDSEITSLETSLENDIIEYEKISNEMAELIHQQENFFNNHNLKEEEIASSLETNAKKKFEMNKQSFTLQNRIMEEKKLIQYFNNLKNQDQEDLQEEEQRQEEEQHLEEVVKAKEEELAKEKRQEILDGAEILYTTHLSFDGRANNPRDIVVKEEQLQKLEEMIDSVPQKIVGTEQVYDYEPDKVPKDLEDVDMAALQEDKQEVVVGPITSEVLTLYSLADSTNKYVANEILDRFHLIPLKEPIMIDGNTYYPLKEEDIKYITNNQLNDYSPYFIEEKELVLPKEEVKEEPVEETNNQEVIVIYQDANDENKLFTNITTLQRFGVFPLEEYTYVGEDPCYQIRIEDKKKIQDFIEKNPRLSLEIKEIENEKIEETPQEIIETPSITEKITLAVKEVEEPTFTNIRSSKPFLEELKKGTYSYNVITDHAGQKEASNRFIKLLLNDFKETPLLNEYVENLNKLTDTEIEFLMHEWEDDHKIGNLNPYLLMTIKQYVLEKLVVYERNIASEYASLFHIMEQIKTLEESLTSDTITKNLSDSFLTERRRQFDEAALNIENITEMRNTVDKLLGKGLFINISEFSKQFPYIGMRYEKALNEEVQNFLEENQEKLNAAIEANNSEEIVSRFINVDSCFYDNPAPTLHKKSRTIGVQYYNILQKQFGFQNDAFIQQITAKEAEAKATSHEIINRRMKDMRFTSLLDSMEEITSEEFLDKKPTNDDLKELDKTLAEYELNRLSQEEIINSIEELIESSNAKLVDSINSASISLKKYEEKNPLYNVNDIQAKLDLLMAHPELICSFDSLEGERLYSELMILPKELLTSLVADASSVVLAKDLKEHAKQLVEK